MRSSKDSRTLGELLEDFEKAVEYLRISGFLPATSGNISLRYRTPGEERIYISPSGVDKKLLSRENLVAMSIEGEVIYAPKGLKPSSEWRLHLEVYRKLPEAVTVIHVHPTYALIWAEERGEIDVQAIPEGMELFKGEKVKVLEPLPPGTQEFGEGVARAFAEGYRAVLVKGHGLVIWDEYSPLRASYRIEVVERVAKLSLLRELLRR